MIGTTMSRRFTRAFRSLRRAVEYRLPLRPRHPLRHPRRRRLTLEPVAEPLVDAAVIVDLVLLLSEPMIFTRVHQQHEVITAGSAREVVELDALMPIDRAVRVAEFHQHRCLELVDLRRG